MFNLKKALYITVLFGYSVAHAGSFEDFFQAAKIDDSRTTASLLARGFDPNSVDASGMYALLWAMRTASWKVANVLVDNPATNVEVRTAQDESPLMFAAFKGNMALCQKLIARGAAVNKPGWTPLHYAATNAHLDIMKMLLAQSANIDAESPNGSTPLMMAAMYGNTAAVKLLLDAGADPHLKNSLGMNALDFAQKVDNKDSVNLVAAAMRAKPIQ